MRIAGIAHRHERARGELQMRKLALEFARLGQHGNRDRARRRIASDTPADILIERAKLPTAGERSFSSAMMSKPASLGSSCGGAAESRACAKQARLGTQKLRSLDALPAAQRHLPEKIGAHGGRA